MPQLNQMLARSSHQVPWITKQVRRLMRSMVMGDVEKTTRQFMSSIPDADKAVLCAPGNTEILVSSIREDFRQGSQGVALDDILVTREWGFDLKRVKHHMDIWHGEADVNVPIHAGSYLREVIHNGGQLSYQAKDISLN